MSEVYLGTDEVLDRPVAIKVLRGGFEGSDVGVRFSREGRTAARLSHPNVVQVYDAGEDVLEGREVSYIVMEYVPGGDLKAMMDDRGRLAEGELARIGADVVAGLAHAHERGIVHRDIKPHNVLMDTYGRPKLTDFGIAKALDATTTTTQSGSYLGTALYSSPEQLRGQPATPKSDVYALGATLYHAALGEPLFAGGPLQVASQQLSNPPTPPRARGAEIGARMDDLIMRCLSKDPDARPTTSELGTELLSISAANVTGASEGTVGSKSPSASEDAAPVVENAQAAGAAAISGIARAVIGLGKGTAGVGEAARAVHERLASDGGGDAKPALSGDPAQTVTFPTRTFRPGHERGRNLLIVMAIPVLILAAVLIWGISSFFAVPETAENGGGSGARQEAATAGNADGAGSSGSGAGDGANSDTEQPQSEADKEGAKDKKVEPESAGPPADPVEAENAVFEMYVAAAENRFDDSYGYLSKGYREEVVSVAAWESRYEDLSYLTFSSGPSGRTADGVTEVAFTAEESRSDGQKTVEGVWVVIEEEGEPRLDQLIQGKE